MKTLIRDFAHYFLPLYAMLFLCVKDNVENYTIEGKILIHVAGFIVFGIITWMFNIAQAIINNIKENMYEVYFGGAGAVSGCLIYFFFPSLREYANGYVVFVFILATIFDLANLYFRTEASKSNQRKLKIETEFRKFAIKNFVLGYSVKMFGKYWNYPRASRITFPVFVLTGFLSVTNPDWPNPTFLIWMLYVCTTLCLWLGFPKLWLWFGYGYFNMYPIKFKELDKLQKYQYGNFYKENMTTEEYNEWKMIYNEINR